MSHKPRSRASGGMGRGIFQAGVCLTGALAVGLGCAAGGVRASSRGVVDVAQQASYDHHFYSEVEEFAKLPEAERKAQIEQEIERLAGPAWKEARSKLFTMGKDAIELLIKNIERTEPTEAMLYSLPGRAVKEKLDIWPLGRVVHEVLCEFVSSHTNYEGALPGFSKAEWTSWWAKNGKDLSVYSEYTRAPAYVRAQMEAARKALSARYEPTTKLLAQAPPAQERRSTPKAKPTTPEKPAKEVKAKPAAPAKEVSAPDAREKGKPAPAAEPEGRKGRTKKPAEQAPKAAAPAPEKKAPEAEKTSEPQQ